MDSAKMALHSRNVVVCIGGGIAAYKGAFLVRELVKAGAKVRVVMSRAACEFITPLTLQTLSNHPVLTDMFDRRQDADIGHIRVVDGADLVIVAPATADLIARMRAGLANDGITAAVLAATCPVLLAPAMNVNMWEHPATRANLEELIARGIATVGPDDGFLACQWTGSGRMSEPTTIAARAGQLLTKQDLRGLEVVVTAGGTREPMDAVRFLGNRSTGRMGFAVAERAAVRGARVHLIHAPVAIEPPLGVELEAVVTAEQMRDAVSRWRNADVMVLAAAVADFRPREPVSGKIKKDTMPEAPTLPLERTVDILAELGGARVKGCTLVGFAAETENTEQNARDKLMRKRCDLVVANDVSQPQQGFESETNAVMLVTQEGTRAVPLQSKLGVADAIWDRVLELRSEPMESI